MKRIVHVIFVFAIISSVWGGSAWGASRDAEHATLLKGRQALREQMAGLLVRMSDLDIMKDRGQALDYELARTNAKGILEALARVRKLDKENLFADELRRVETPTRDLLQYAEKKDPRIRLYPDRIFNACFRCHEAHRDNPMRP